MRDYSSNLAVGKSLHEPARKWYITRFVSVCVFYEQGCQRLLVSHCPRSGQVQTWSPWGQRDLSPAPLALLQARTNTAIYKVRRHATVCHLWVLLTGFRDVCCCLLCSCRCRPGQPVDDRDILWDCWVYERKPKLIIGLQLTMSNLRHPVHGHGVNTMVF